MTEIRFYHLQKTPLDQALPIILEKALQGGFRATIIVPDDDIKSSLDDWLWTYKEDSFLPHGCDDKDNAQQHPIVITTSADNNINKSNMLVLTHGCTSDKIGEYKLCCEMLNGALPEQVSSARERWKGYKEKGYDITYWAQDDNGRWAQKA